MGDPKELRLLPTQGEETRLLAYIPRCQSQSLKAVLVLKKSLSIFSCFQLLIKRMMHPSPSFSSSWDESSLQYLLRYILLELLVRTTQFTEGGIGSNGRESWS